MKQKIIRFIDNVLGPLLIVPTIIAFTFGPLAVAIYLDQQEMDKKEANHYASRDRNEKIHTYTISESFTRVRDYAQDCPR